MISVGFCITTVLLTSLFQGIFYLCKFLLTFIIPENTIYTATTSLKYNNQHNEELTLVLEKKNERINATSIVKNKYIEDGTDAFYLSTLSKK